MLDLSGNQLTSLPTDLPRLHRLRVLFCSDNPFTELPPVLGQCGELELVGFKACRIERVTGRALPARLRWLILTDNCVESLPAEIGRCSRLQKLMLAGNRLRALPPELATCTRLELLRISANRLQELPDWLADLPRLAWLAYAGNPCCERHEAAAQVQTPASDLHWNQLELQQLLGQGASGWIHRALRRDGQEPAAIALKIFKGDVTSDGLPDSEVAAWLRAGQHPGLIPVLGRVQGHPDGAQALAMPLVNAAFGSLAGPPSLDSCTRDCYAPETRFTPDEALGVARSVAAAVAHLHRRGVLHGDLYGHNILHDGRGRALLGDFGAASLFDPGDSWNAPRLQRIEVRAFGCLLEELIERAQTPPDAAACLDPLRRLRDACLSGEPARRPRFEQIEDALARLAGAGKPSLAIITP